MSKKKPTAGQSGAAEKSEQPSALSKGATENQRVNIKMVQNVLLIWLDSNIDDNNDDCNNTVSQLRQVVNDVNTFTDSGRCVQFIERINDEKACMIISGSLGEHIVPRIHNMSQVDSIFIFSGNKKCHEQWTIDWSKIKGVFTDIAPICEALKQAAQECEQNAIPMSFMATGGDTTTKSLNQLDCTFMYTQIMKEIILNITFDNNHIKEFIQYCGQAFADNKKQMINVKELERKYHQKTPVWWYTCESFLYPMLNRALRLMDADVIVKMGFFIGDLHRQIEQLHNDPLNDHHTSATFKVFRGQGLKKTDFEQMSKTKGGLLSFNNFLSTSTDRNISLRFARRALSSPDMVGILFVMTIDPSPSTTPFASIKSISYFSKEDEILFSMHTVFRIHDIKRMDENQQLFQVDLTLTSDNDEDLRVLSKRIQEEIDADSTEWYRLGKLLLKIGQFDKAQQVYEVLLNQAMNDIDKALSYHHIGWARWSKGEYKEALSYYEKALNIRRQSLPSNHPDFSKSYIGIGSVHYSMGEYSKALSYYKKAVEIQQQSLPPNHPDLARSYNNIGSVYSNMGEYSKALSSHEKALEIKQQLLSSNHPDLASSYNNIGLVYDSIGEYSKALSYYEKALEIKQQSLPPNHPGLASSYGNIGGLYDSIGEYSKALSSHEKALEIRQQSLPPNHPDLASSYSNIGLVYDNMGEYSKALSYYEKDLEISKKSLPPNHPDLASSYGNIGGVYDSIGEYSKALSSHEKALEIKQQSLPPNHLDLAKSYNNIGIVYKNMGEYSKALSYYEKALEISQQSLPPNHPDMAKSYNNIGIVYKNMGEYSKALSYYEKALEIRQQSLPPNHPDLASSYGNIGNVYYSMGECSKALSSYEKALEIQQQSLPPNHPDLAMSYNNIGSVYYRMGEYSKALSSHEKALELRQQSLPPNHPDLALSYNNIGGSYENMRDYSKAHSSYERAVKIAQQTLQSNHPHLQVYRNNLDRVKKKQ
jgi:tetratricopeptide (TPR) repeat protein